jgi:predicted aldo/keto reductase-like oxidoreductase
MNFRPLGATGLRVSEVGLGCEHLQGQPEAAVRAVVERALSYGATLFDVFMSEPEVRSNLGRAFAGRRKEILLQGHIGSLWENGQYARGRALDPCKRHFEDLLTRLGTDYIDIGVLHFVDTEDEWDAVLDSPVMAYTRALKAQGVIKAVGLSSHEPATALKAVEGRAIDVLMFSLNPAFDVLPAGRDIDALLQRDTYRAPGLQGPHRARQALYSACEAAGVGITVMKALAGGLLLDAKSSPFGFPLTPAQCFQYALSRPAVASVLPGCRTPEEVDRAMAYLTATEAERDYSLALAAAPLFSLRGKCVYCGHCLPCPAGIDIALVNRYLDAVSLHGPSDTLGAHYQALAATGGDCLACGDCEGRCPFGVPVREHMAKAREVFGR